MELLVTIIDLPLYTLIPTGPPKISLQKVNRSLNKTKSSSVNNVDVKNRINGNKMLSCVHAN